MLKFIMARKAQEIESKFIPTKSAIAEIKAAAQQELEIIQGYMPMKGVVRVLEVGFNPRTKTIIYKLSGVEILRAKETDRDRAAIIKKEIEENPNFLKQSRIRYQEDIKTNKVSAYLTVKGPANEAGERVELEYKIPVKAAVGILIKLCADKLLYKTRYIASRTLGGVERTLELDEYQGAHRGKYVVEIEYASAGERIKAADIPEITARDGDVSESETWKNANMANPDKAAFKKLNEISKRLENKDRKKHGLGKEGAGIKVQGWSEILKNTGEMPDYQKGGRN